LGKGIKVFKMIKKLNIAQLFHIANSPKAAKACTRCASLSCAGWISVPGYFDLTKLQVLGTLKKEGAEECWDEYHPNGTHLWSDDAPISIGHYPYSRSDILGCSQCKRTFLHYTEYGGYYLDQRIRALNANLIVE
jgi:hypothetical protein